MFICVNIQKFYLFAVQSHFAILTEKDIQKRQEERIASVTQVLSISKTDAGILLRNYEW
jgi:ariadne-1